MYNRDIDKILVGEELTEADTPLIATGVPIQGDIEEPQPAVEVPTGSYYQRERIAGYNLADQQVNYREPGEDCAK